MPDMTMCRGGECPIRETCYRYTAQPCDVRQSYFIEPPYEDGICEYYLPKQPYMSGPVYRGEPMRMLDAAGSLPNDKLRKLAEDRQPPPEWYEGDEEELF